MVSREATIKLSERGVDILHGFHFAKPMTIQEFEGWLE